MFVLNLKLSGTGIQTIFIMKTKTTNYFKCFFIIYTLVAYKYFFNDIDVYSLGVKIRFI